MPDCLATAATSGQIVRKRKRRPMLLDLVVKHLHRLFAFGSALLFCGGRLQMMHRPRRDGICRLLTAMMGAGCLQFECAPCQVTALPGGRMDARPLTVRELAHRAGLGERNAKRCLQDLRDAGMLGKSPQIRRHDGMGGMLVAPKLRTFTERFWKTLGLWDLFRESVIYAMEHGRPIRLRFPLSRIGGVGRIPLKMKLPDTVPKAVPMDRQLSDLAHACLQDRGGACDVSGNSTVCRLCRKARGLA